MGNSTLSGEGKRCSFKICYSGHSNKSFSLGLHLCVCVGMCVFDYLCAVEKKQGGGALKLRALLLCILLCDLEKTLRLFIAEELMLPRINMAKSSYQLHNGQATEVKTTALTMGVCVYVFMYCVCVCSHLPSFLICAGVCTLLDICFFCFF